MNLVIDIGNTNTKTGVFGESGILYRNIIKQSDFENEIQRVFAKYPKIKDAIISSVGRLEKTNIDFVKKYFNTLVLDHMTPMSFSNLYESPTTLGIDRLALVAAAVDQFPKKDVLVIDAGTCITYDFKNHNEEYLGGSIAPGIRLRYTSLHSYTEKLPLLETTFPQNQIGKTTKQAIHSGVIYGVLHEISGVIQQYCNIYPDLTVILTGGDADFLSKRLKNGIFATSNFLLEGLNSILVFNKSK